MRNRAASTTARMLVATAIILMLTTAGRAQDTEKILYTFTDGPDGGDPYSGLILDNKGNLYGTATGGGIGAGVVFELTPQSNGTWTEEVLYSFRGFINVDDGLFPEGSVVFDGKGNLYGTTIAGGGGSNGTVFELSPGANGTWTEKVLYAFTGSIDGGEPSSGLILDSAGNLYGTTESGGQGFGTAYELVAGSNGTWSEKVLHSFTGGNDGGLLNGPLTFDAAGNLYGITLVGGAHDYGVIYELVHGSSGAWTEKIIHAFTGGAGDVAGLGGVSFDSSGNLYSGAIYSVLEFSPNPNGSWTEKNLHNFLGGSDGANAEGTLVLDKAGNLYGMTYNGGVHKGTVFELTPGSNGSWTEKVLHKFTGGSDGINPEYNGLAVDPSGNIYGVTALGGTSNFGVVFEVKP